MVVTKAVCYNDMAYYLVCSGLVFEQDIAVACSCAEYTSSYSFLLEDFKLIH